MTHEVDNDVVVKHRGNLDEKNMALFLTVKVNFKQICYVLTFFNWLVKQHNSVKIHRRTWIIIYAHAIIWNEFCSPGKFKVNLNNTYFTAGVVVVALVYSAKNSRGASDHFT